MVEWWTSQDSGWIGGIGGGVMGIIGGAGGAMAGVLAPKGKCKALVMGLMWAVVVVGVAALGAGLFALTKKQPYHVWYPLTLGGGICAFVFGMLLPGVRMRYRQAEQRKMDAGQIRGG